MGVSWAYKLPRIVPAAFLSMTVLAAPVAQTHGASLVGQTHGAAPVGQTHGAALVAQTHGVAATARRGLQPRPFPSTAGGIAVFADQLPPGLTEAQYRFAATHYAGTQKVTRDEAARLRRYNPRLIILHYRLPIGESDPSVQIVEGNRWVSDYASVTRHEDWFYHLHGARVLQKQWHWYLMDPASGWRDYWLAAVRRALVANDDDGVFADSLSVPNEFGGASWTPPLRDYDPPFEQWWSAQIDAFLAYVRPRLHGALLIPNAGAWVTTRDTTDLQPGRRRDDRGLRRLGRP